MRGSAPIPARSKLGIGSDHKQDLVTRDRRSIRNGNRLEHAVNGRREGREQLHDFDQAQRVALSYAAVELDEWRLLRLGAPVECSELQRPPCDIPLPHEGISRA